MLNLNLKRKNNRDKRKSLFTDEIVMIVFHIITFSMFCDVVSVLAGSGTFCPSCRLIFTSLPDFQLYYDEKHRRDDSFQSIPWGQTKKKRKHIYLEKLIYMAVLVFVWLIYDRTIGIILM